MWRIQPMRRLTPLGGRWSNCNWPQLWMIFGLKKRVTLLQEDHDVGLQIFLQSRDFSLRPVLNTPFGMNCLQSVKFLVEVRIFLLESSFLHGAIQRLSWNNWAIETKCSLGGCYRDWVGTIFINLVKNSQKTNFMICFQMDNIPHALMIWGHAMVFLNAKLRDRKVDKSPS
jgi:hypothetical protein